MNFFYKLYQHIINKYNKRLSIEKRNILLNSNISNIILELKNNNVKNLQKLKKIFNEFDKQNKINVKNKFIYEIITGIKLFNQNLSNVDDKLANQIINSTQKYSCSDWLILYQLLLTTTMFKSALSIRDKAKIEALKNIDLLYKLTTRQLKESLSFALECDLIDKALQVTNDLKIRNIYYKKYEPFDLNNVIEFIENRYSFYHIGKSLNTNVDNNFRKIIKNKKIALVGPAVSEANNQDEINEYDLIVSLNFSVNKHEKEMLPDIIYYNGEKIEMILKNELDTIPADIKFAVVKNKNHVPILDNMGINVKPLHMFKYLSYGTFNAIPNAVFDLLLYEPQELKIFNVSLLLPDDKGNAYNIKYSTSNKKSGNQKIINSFPVHDPILQFKWLKLLYRHKKFYCDNVLAEILNYSEEEYISKLRNAYKYTL